MKIHEIAALGRKRYRNVTKSVPDVKITLFCKVLPGRAQKRDFSSIFVGYSSRIFDDFHGFSQISSFLHIVLNASMRQIASKYVHFMDLVWTRAISDENPRNFGACCKALS